LEYSDNVMATTSKVACRVRYVTQARISPLRRK
jgi:hypothetical protein